LKLVVKNIGGLVGEHSFEFREGVNEVLAPNATGKTSLIRAMLALLSPQDPNVRPDILLNRDADDGYIKLVVDGEEYYRVFKRRNGYVVEVRSKLLADDERFSWLILDPFMGRLVTSIYAGEEDVSEFIDVIFGITKIKQEIEDTNIKIKDEEIKREELLDKSRDLANLLKERVELERKLKEALEKAKKVEVEKIRVKEEIERRITQLREIMGELKGRLEANKRELSQTIETIKDLEAHIRHMENALSEFYRKYPEPHAIIENMKQEIDNIRRAIREHEERLAEINRANPLVLDAASKRLPLCPVCGRAVEKPDKFWSRRVGELGEAAGEIKKEIDKLSEREQRILNEIGVIEKEWSRIRTIETVDLPSKKNQLSLLQRRKSTLESDIKNIERQIEVLEERIIELERKMPEEERKYIEEVARVRGEVKSLQELLKGIERRIEILGDVGRELKEVEETLSKLYRLKDQLERTLLETRRRVAMEFRRMANDIARKLGFTWFKSIALDEEDGKYKIRVIRVFPSGREDKQDLRELSTSEKLSIVLIATLVAYKEKISKEYSPEKVPILADEALLALDPERFEKVLRELGKYGKYIIVTRLAEPSKTPKITIVHRK